MAKKRGRGRPPVADPREYRVTVNFTRAEKRFIEKAAKDAGYSISDYIRLRVR